MHLTFSPSVAVALGGVLFAHVQHVCNLSRFFFLSNRRRLLPRAQRNSVRQFFHFLPREFVASRLFCLPAFRVGVPFSFHASNRRLGRRRTTDGRVLDKQRRRRDRGCLTGIGGTGCPTSPTIGRPGERRVPSIVLLLLANVNEWGMKEAQLV